jgi:hypothetical protein
MTNLTVNLMMKTRISDLARNWHQLSLPFLPITKTAFIDIEKQLGWHTREPFFDQSNILVHDDILEDILDPDCPQEISAWAQDPDASNPRTNR